MCNRFLSGFRSGKIINLFILLIGFIFGLVTVFQFRKMMYVVNHRVLCHAEMNIHRESKLLSMHLQYIMEDGRGVIIMRGRISDNDRDIGIISRDIDFDYQRKNSHVNVLLVRSIKKTAQDSADDNILAPLLPEIWSGKGNQGIFFIYPQYPDGYVFGRSALPSFYCKNIN